MSILSNQLKEVPTGDPRFRFRRLQGGGSHHGVVVLLHGGNTSGDTFLYPNGGLVEYLARKGWDVWLMEWRGSPHVFPFLPAELDHFTVDEIADDDIPSALRFVRSKVAADRRLAVVAHCLSGCAVSMAIARGHIPTSLCDTFCLTTLGLFFESCWDGWLKAEDFVLERILTTGVTPSSIDPQNPHGWPEPLRVAYERWPRAWLPEWSFGASDPLQTLTFMFGRPYWRRALHSDLYGGALRRLFSNTLRDMFGPMGLGMYLHVGQMVRRGFAARYDTLDVLDRPRLAGASLTKPSETDVDDAEHFAERHITLITGAENQLWHRDSIDLMYEWLRATVDPHGEYVRKKILPGYGHQDLYWGKESQNDMYPEVLSALS